MLKCWLSLSQVQSKLCYWGVVFIAWTSLDPQLIPELDGFRPVTIDTCFLTSVLKIWCMSFQRISCGLKRFQALLVVYCDRLYRTQHLNLEGPVVHPLNCPTPSEYHSKLSSEPSQQSAWVDMLTALEPWRYSLSRESLLVNQLPFQ